EKALATLGLVGQALFEDLLIFLSEWGLLSAPPWLLLVERGLAAGRVDAVSGIEHGVRRKPPLPGASPVGILRIGCLGGGCADRKDAGQCSGRDQTSVKHGVTPWIVLAVIRKASPRGRFPATEM